MGCTQSTQSTPQDVRTRSINATSTHPAARSPIPQRSLTSTSHASATSAALGIPNSTTATPPGPLRLRTPRRWKSAASPPPTNTSSLTTGPPSARWTHALLARERTAFFDTRVTGRQEIWQAIQLALDMIRPPIHSPSEPREGERVIKKADLKAAASVLEAAGCTVQRGRLEEGVWDDRGGLYALPEWVVSDPSDVIEDVEMGGMTGVATASEHDNDGDVTEAEDEAAYGEDGEFEGKEAEGGSDMVMREKMAAGEAGEVKGKGKVAVVPPALKDPVKMKVRLSDRGTDVVVLVDREESVKGVVKRILEEAELPTKSKVRLVYMGKMLAESSSPAAQGWAPGHVINALVFP